MPEQDFDKSLSYRRELVHTLYREGNLHSARVAVAFMRVPREAFVPGLPLADVYRPAEAIVVKRANGATLSSASAPEVIALMLEQLDPRPGDRVLEIGAGTGYNAALLAHLVGELGTVTSVDIDEDMVRVAREHLDSTGFDRVEVVQADGALANSDSSTHDRIIVTAASNDIAPAWRQELARPHGRLVMPLALRGLQRCAAFTPGEGGSLECRSLRPCAFITLRGALGPDASRSPAFIGSFGSSPLVSSRTDVSLSVEQLRQGLQLWLVAHDPNVYSVWGDARVPELFGFGERGGPRGTMCVLDAAQTSVALLAWADQSTVGGELVVLAPPGAVALADRLTTLVRAWVAADYPTDGNAEIRAYPRANAPGPAQDEVAIDQRWTRFLLSWRKN